MGMTPFPVVQGHPPPTIIHFLAHHNKIGAVSQTPMDTVEILRQLEYNLQ